MSVISRPRRHEVAKRTPASLRRAARNHPPRLGGFCPACRKGRLGLDGCLNLACPLCGHLAPGAFT